MAFEKFNWQPRTGVGLNKFTDRQTGNLLELESTPDSVESVGTPFSAAQMNWLEDRIATAFDAAMFKVDFATRSPELGYVDKAWQLGCTPLTAADNIDSLWGSESAGVYSGLAKTVQGTFPDDINAGWAFTLEAVQVSTVVFQRLTSDKQIGGVSYPFTWERWPGSNGAWKPWASTYGESNPPPWSAITDRPVIGGGILSLDTLITGMTTRPGECNVEWTQVGKIVNFTCEVSWSARTSSGVPISIYLSQLPTAKLGNSTKRGYGFPVFSLSERQPVLENNPVSAVISSNYMAVGVQRPVVNLKNAITQASLAPIAFAQSGYLTFSGSYITE
ncbi:hypothetical protein LJC60_01140 [Ruminococcaceae bacterium OttesenSCG-928-D13]|nr:hypothetical protein [Ruminococcaceae bacterium OttesenSCG-928-D13]